MDVAEFQKALSERFLEKDRVMGSEFIFSVLAEEVGELARALRKGERADIQEELVDVVFASLCLANLHDVSLWPALKEKYLDRTPDEVSANWNDVTWR